MTDLLDSMEALTKPRRSKTVQTNDAGITCTSPVELPSLLEQLDEAIRSNMGGTTLGGSDPATRSLVNAAALEKLMQISGQVRGWARMSNAVVDKDSLTVTLQRWHLKFIEYAKSPEVEGMYAQTMGKWAAQIVATLDPPREKDLPSECPSCGATEWWRDGERFYRPLIIRYRPADSGVVTDATGFCRACEAVWSARELAFELERADETKEAIA